MQVFISCFHVYRPLTPPYSTVLGNTLVDGIKGQATASFTLQPETDICPPVVQLLQFRNTNNYSLSEALILICQEILQYPPTTYINSARRVVIFGFA